MIHQPNYPRPQLARHRKSWQALNGTWGYGFAVQNKGLTENWQQGVQAQYDINVKKQ